MRRVSRPGRLILSTVTIGVLVGIGATGFHFVADRFGDILFAWVESQTAASRLPFVLIVPTVGLGLVGLILQYYPAGREGGVREVFESLEQHAGCNLWVHRKGAMSARLGESGVLPGSMGSLSFHVEGRGCEEALCSSAHGAGRVLSRTAARRQVTERSLRQQMEGIWYDSRKTDGLRDEAPSAYKDIRAVLRAQKDMVKVTRTLRPVLNYKGL